jgi:hypothetical protein
MAILGKIMRKNLKNTNNISLLIEKYKNMFRIPENLNYYSKRDFKIAEKKYVKYALTNGHSFEY